MELVPIKVKILTKPEGGCLYPDFNTLACVQGSGMDWSRYIDRYGSGWLYDNKCGHAEVDSDSPEGEWYALLLIPNDFANQAVAAFPDEVTMLTEVQAQTFYESRYSINMPDEEINTDILLGIKAKDDLGLSRTAGQQKALDPNDDTPGIRKNKRKLFADFKSLRNITIKK